MTFLWLARKSFTDPLMAFVAPAMSLFVWYISLMVELIVRNGIILLSAHTAAVLGNRGQSNCPAESRARDWGAEDKHFSSGAVFISTESRA